MIHARPPFSPNLGLRKRRTVLGGAFGLLSATLIAGWGCGQPAPDPVIPAVGTGGAPAGNGGAPTATGGEAMATGGEAMATGGAPATTGGAPATTGGAPGATGGAPPTPECVTTIVTTKCSNSCHSMAQAPFFGGLNLEGDYLPRILDKPATYMGVTDTTGCIAGAKLIDSATPENSVLLKKVNGTQNCGTLMPQTGMLTADERTCIQNWIQTF